MYSRLSSWTLSIAIFLGFFLLAFPAKGQEQHNAFTLNSTDNIIPIYLKFGMGGGYFSYRDLVTSPLFYKGGKGNIALSVHKHSQKRESALEIHFSLGEGKAYSDNYTTSSLLYYSEIHYKQLYQIPGILEKPWNLKVGGEINLSGNLRLNNNLYNNSSITEGLGTLFAAFKLGRDISRTKEHHLEWWFFNIHLLPRKRNLFWQLNLAIMNNTFRKNYSYINHSSIFNDYKRFSGHQLNLFSGYRINSSLEYNIYLKNQNIIQLSYLWDSYFTGENPDRLEIARHRLMISFLFSLTENVSVNNKTLNN